MLVEINIPDVGCDELEVTDILVNIGDKVEIEQSLIVVEGEKVSLEIPSPKSGIVKNINITIGDKVSTGSLFMIIEIKNQELKHDITKKLNLELDKHDKEISILSVKELKKIYLPNIGDNKLKVIDIMVNIGSIIINENSLIKLYGNNMLIEFIAPFSGMIKSIDINIGDIINSHSLLMTIEIQPSNKQINNIDSINFSKSIEEKQYSFNNTNNFNHKNNKFNNNFSKNIHATPLIRRLARKFGINLSNIKGTGIKNRILREDIQQYIKNIIELSNKKNDELKYNFMNIMPLPKIDYSKFGEFEEVKLTNIQKTTSSNLTRNWITIPHVTVMEDIDITEVENFRKQQNNELKNFQLNDVKITILVFVMKAVASTLLEMPHFNSSLSLDFNKIIVKKYINIGIAIDTIYGLFVPVIRDVNKKNILELSKELILISKKARLGELSMTDIQGGSFTISNLGNIGTINFTPIINAPEVAIIGISRSLIKPVWNGTKFISRLILPISLSFDHRVINGADGARFITKIATLMSDIRRLIL